MTKDSQERDLPPEDPDKGTERRRVRLRPREGTEHQFRFARRWESRRKARRPHQIWKLAMMDFGAVLLIYLLAREVLRRFGVG